MCLDKPETFLQLERIGHALAAATPVTRPREEIAYHAITYGWLLDEVVRRVTGIDIGQQFANLIATPLQLNIRIGPMSRAIGRPARLSIINQNADDLAAVVVRSQSTRLGKAMLYCSPLAALDVDGIANSAAYPEAGQPAAGGLADARSLARAYGMMACGILDGIRYLTHDSIELFSASHSQGYDLVTEEQVERGLGYKRNLGGHSFGQPPNAYGHGGLGGSLAFADPDGGLGFGFIVNGLDIGPDEGA